MRHVSSAAGFTLIEALVALVIIAVGLLGLLGLQSAAIIATDSAGHVSLARIAGSGMADRIRANPAPAARSVYAAVSPTSAVASSNTSCIGAANPCTPGEMARQDSREWQMIVARSLPQGQGFVDCAVNDQPCPLLEVTVGWREREQPNTTAPPGLVRCASQTHAAAIDGPCIVTQVRP
ncbi:type IV pilus modification protein PilV [Salinisphaera japonica]|uniref:Pilus modification protein PilV n=1 Tax=Salinisphaera japonica YTM-1 TaxID=1209778 RepID=A0A423PS27_9GAMM|nr:type IV pilus modification protein PilV [Salinisphaera japonica]ROO28400.1 pilus modification protein PilV [Salinisphaera japonica YTM-1]